MSYVRESVDTHAQCTERSDEGLAPGTRLCFVADGRSPIARNWIGDYGARGFEVHLISTYPCDGTGLGLASLTVIPAAFGRLAGGGASLPTAAAGGAAPSRRPSVSTAVRRVRAAATSALLPTVLGWLAPFDLAPHVRRLREVVRRIDPALVHAMRVPYEGVLAALALEDSARPLVMSIWGNDLELWAARYPFVARLTRRALRRATALHPDCVRDLRLAAAWGWNAARPASVIPGNGGVRSDVFHAGAADPALLARFDLPSGGPLVLNARGIARKKVSFRTYPRNPRVLERHPDAVFAGVGMRGHPAALRWTRTLGIGDAVRLLPPVPPAEIAALFRSATAAVSPATFDGTPNTLLEAMACGAFPVAGDIASVREWIDDGRNGLLFDPSSPRALADALVRALDDAPLRVAASAINAALVAERAEFRAGMRRADALYAAAVDEAARARADAPSPMTGGGRAPAAA